jgi:two-component system, LytTR family, response regulator
MSVMKSPGRVVIVDDERLARKYLKQLLADHDGVEVVGEADNIVDAARLCAQEGPDLLFLDIQMPGGSGFELLRGLEPAPRVIFVTAHSEYAVRAFDVQAVDYLLKPVAPERMQQALQRAGLLPGEAQALTLDDSVCLRDGTQVVVTPLRDIAVIEAQADYTRVRFASHPPLLVHRRMHEWETLLPDHAFARLDRSLFVNLGLIARLEADSRDAGRLFLSCARDPLSLGRAAVARARALLDVTR